MMYVCVCVCVCVLSVWKKERERESFFLEKRRHLVHHFPHRLLFTHVDHLSLILCLVIHSSNIDYISLSNNKKLKKILTFFFFFFFFFMTVVVVVVVVVFGGGIYEF